MNKVESEMSEIFSFDSLDSCYKPFLKPLIGLLQLHSGDLKQQNFNCFI